MRRRRDRGFRAALAETDVRVTMAHDSYLINLASPDKVLRRRSTESFVAELRRCEALGLTYLVSHRGNFMDDRASGLARNADAIAEALERVPGRTVLCLETTAGSGTALGATFEELAAIIKRLPAKRPQNAWALRGQLPCVLRGLRLGEVVSRPTGLLPEQYDALAERGLGNHPQAYSHLGLINCAMMLSD